jgi:EF-hand domain pair
MIHGTLGFRDNLHKDFTVRLLLGSVMLVCSACANAAPYPAFNEEGARRVFNTLDANEDGRISHQEWAILESREAAMVPKEQRQQMVGPLEDAFKRMDLNHDGSLTFAEWKKVNSKPPPPCPRCQPVTPGWVPLQPAH